MNRGDTVKVVKCRSYPEMVGARGKIVSLPKQKMRDSQKWVKRAIHGYGIKFDPPIKQENGIVVTECPMLPFELKLVKGQKQKGGKK